MYRQLLLLLLTSAALAADRPPNIVLILVDDLGYGDVGCFGAKDIRTPNIDALAKQGTRFTNFYVCLLYTSPSPRDRQKSRMPSSA